MFFRQELANRLSYERRTPEPTAHDHFEAHFATGVALHDHAYVVNLDRGAIVIATRDRDFELTRKERELRMQGRPLACDLAPNAWIFDLTLSGAGVLIRRDVADAVPAGLNRVHLDFGELGKNIRRLFQLRPVVLNILACGEVAVACRSGARCTRASASVASRAFRKESRRAACRRAAEDKGRSLGGAVETALR